MSSYQLGQPVKHKKRNLHEATFSGHTKTGRIRVTYNYIYPMGAAWTTDSFDPKYIEPINLPGEEKDNA